MQHTQEHQSKAQVWHADGGTVRDGHGQVVAQVVAQDEDNSDALLMAAAPRMMSALKRIREARDYCADHGTYPPDSVASDQAFDDWAADLVDTALRGLD
jgi:hypothetical protein